MVYCSMKFLVELRKDGDVSCDSYQIRRAGRAIIFNESGEVALVNVTRDGYYKIPGGGVEDGEDIGLAVIREVKEEAGCEIEIVGEVGVIIEFLNNLGILQINYCFVAKATKLESTSFTNEEKDAGFTMEWHRLDRALELMENACPQQYRHWFMATRDYKFMQAFAENDFSI